MVLLLMIMIMIMIMIKIMNFSSSVPVDMTSVYEFHMWLLSLLTDICGKLMGLADNDYDNDHADENGDFDHGHVMISFSLRLRCGHYCVSSLFRQTNAESSSSSSSSKSSSSLSLWSSLYYHHCH